MAGLRACPFGTCLLWACLLALLAGCGQRGGDKPDLWEHAAIRKAQERGRLRVALEPEFPPFEYVDERGELAGFDVDLARMIAGELGVPVEFQQVNFNSIILTLVTGEVDLIISGMTATPERALQVSYSDPYFHTVTCLLVSRQRAADVRSIADLDQEGRVVVVKQATTGEVAARKRCPKAKIVSFPKENAAALEVAQGLADAFLYDLRSILNHHEKHPDTTFTLLTPVSVEPYSIACRKGDPESVAWLNLVLHHMRRDGRLKELYGRHGLEDAEGP